MKIENEYKSNIDLQEFDGKLYIDPLYGEFKPKSVVNYSTLTGKWDIEDVSEENGIKIIQRETGDNIVLSFDSYADKVAFAKILYPIKPVEQIGPGFNLKMYINRNALNPRINVKNLLSKVKIKDLLPRSEINMNP